jgi:hypothetical protein
MKVGSPHGIKSEKSRLSFLVSGMRELHTLAPRKENRERDSLDYDEGVHLFALGQRLQQGVEPGRRICASGAVVESRLVHCLGNDGS